MKATLLYILVHTFALLSVGSSTDRIENLASKPIQQCSKDFSEKCKTQTNSEEVAGKSVLLSTCLPFRDAQDIPINRRQCYRTCTYLADDIKCVRCIDDTPKPLRFFEGSFYTVYQVRSREEPYEPNIICDYRLKCDRGQSMFYRFHIHELEPRPSRDAICPDTLTISTTGGVLREPTCGREFPRKIEFKDDELYTSFASNGKKEFRGFFALAYCVSDRSNEGPPGDCEYFDLPRGRPKDGHDRGKRSFRTPHFTVKPGQVVRYTDYTVTVERVSDGKILHKFKNIRVLQTYNQFESFVTYQKTAGSRFFPGFGKLRIGYGIVQYTQTDIDPRFIPSAEEIRRINILIGNLTAAGFFDDERFILPDGFPEPSTPGPGTPGPGTPGVPGTPTDDPCSNLDNLPIDLARESANGCNGFLRAAADHFLEIVAICNPTPGPVGPA